MKVSVATLISADLSHLHSKNLSSILNPISGMTHSLFTLPYLLSSLTPVPNNFRISLKVLPNGNTSG